MKKVNDNYVEEEDVEMTPEEIRTDLLINEDEILKALADKDNHSDSIRTVNVNFGKAKFAFRIRPLSEKEYDKCRERATKYQKMKRLGGMRLPESTDTPAYHTELIYAATIDEDKAKLWDNKRLWQATGAITGRDMVDKLIPLAGQKQKIIDLIESISGFDDDDEYQETVKN